MKENRRKKINEWQEFDEITVRPGDRIVIIMLASGGLTNYERKRSDVDGVKGKTSGERRSDSRRRCSDWWFRAATQFSYVFIPEDAMPAACGHFKVATGAKGSNGTRREERQGREDRLVRHETRATGG